MKNGHISPGACVSRTALVFKYQLFQEIVSKGKGTAKITFLIKDFSYVTDKSLIAVEDKKLCQKNF